MHWVLVDADLILSDTQFHGIFEGTVFETTQRILLMSALPKRLEAHLLTLAHLPPDTPIIRAPCDQPNISYIKLAYNTAEMNKIRLVIEAATILNAAIGPDRIGIVFCPSHAEADELGLRFTQGCVSHPRLPDKKKEENEAEWKSGKKQWIAATAGLALSTNSLTVGAVIFLGVDWGMNFLYQGAGQSGRDGERSWVVVLQDKHSQFAMPHDDDEDPQCLVESWAWLQADQCRRLGFTELYDDALVPCVALPNAHFCDFCKPDSDLVVKLNALIVNPPVFQ